MKRALFREHEQSLTPAGQRRQLIDLTARDRRRYRRQDVLVGEQRPPDSRRQIGHRVREDNCVDLGPPDEPADVSLHS